MTAIEFRSDNSAGVAPEVMAALADANVGTALAYGGDSVSDDLGALVCEVFEHPEARVFPVSSGTAANALSLDAMCTTWQAIICHETAHILRNECGAATALAGAVMHGVIGHADRLTADAFRVALDRVNWGNSHQSQPAVLSLTQPTDSGTIYSLDEMGELAQIAREYGMRVHVDGARIANAIVALGCTPAEITWRAGADVVSLGSSKNGAMSVDAIVTFDERIADRLAFRTKQLGQVTSKMRFQSAQLHSYLHDGLWLRLAEHSNRQLERLARGLRKLPVEIVHEPAVNMLFVRMAEQDAARLIESDVQCYRPTPDTVRLVTSWQTTTADVDRALECFVDAVSTRQANT